MTTNNTEKRAEVRKVYKLSKLGLTAGDNVIAATISRDGYIDSDESNSVKIQIAQSGSSDTHGGGSN